MNKSVKISALMLALIAGSTAWAAELTANTGNFTQSRSGISTDTLTNANLSETVTIKMSKSVMGAYDISLGGGLAGVAMGHPNGRGHIYPNGTSAIATNLQPTNTPVASISNTTLQAAATSAAS